MKKMISMVCDKCHLVMPIDREKTSKNWKVYINKCSCGSTKASPNEHWENQAPTVEELKRIQKLISTPSQGD
jgi:hypothetical protein